MGQRSLRKAGDPQGGMESTSQARSLRARGDLEAVPGGKSSGQLPRRVPSAHAVRVQD